MTVEQLMQPRYEVIADYPSNTFDIGQILTESNKIEDWACTDNFLHGFKISSIKKYPHLFLELAWYEKREVSEMPEYVKWDYMPKVDDVKMKGVVERVEGWVQAGFGVILNGHSTASKNWKPATQSEYEQYKKSKQ